MLQFENLFPDYYAEHITNFECNDILYEILCSLRKSHSNNNLETCTVGGFQTHLDKPLTEQKSYDKGMNESYVKVLDKFKNELLKPAWNLYLNKLNFKLDNDNELLYKNWFVFYNKNSYQQVHTHGNNLFTMIYFCKVSKTSNENEGQLVITDVKNKSNGIESKYVTPVETKLVIFPAYYPHYTLPIFSDTERVVIVNDIYLRAKY